MSLSPGELYALILAALKRLQDDGGRFRSGIEKNHLSREEFWLLNRFRYFPNTATPGDFQTFDPYTSSSIYENSLNALVAKKLAEEVDEGRYRSSEAGHKLIDGLYRDYFNTIAKHNGLPEADVRQLGVLTDRALTSALHQPAVPALITSAARSTFPAMEDPWVYAERRVVALATFHDDAHIAAWREEGWSGPRIAVSTALYQAESHLNYAQLREATSQLDDKDFKSALSALHAGGEVSRSADDYYALTPSGWAARRLVDELTDWNYGLPFNALESIELQKLIDLLEQVRGPTKS